MCFIRRASSTSGVSKSPRRPSRILWASKFRLAGHRQEAHLNAPSLFLALVALALPLARNECTQFIRVPVRIRKWTPLLAERRQLAKAGGRVHVIERGAYIARYDKYASCRNAGQQRES